MNVLIVDDETIMREAFTRLFNWEKYGLTQIGQAKNGQEALQMIKEKEVDIVITDLKMPVMDGLTLIYEAQKIKPSLKFVVMSAYDTFDLVSEAYKLGVKDYFLKLNLDVDKVMEMLSRLKDEIIKERDIERQRKEQDEVVKVQRQKILEMEAKLSEKNLMSREHLLKRVLRADKEDISLQEQLRDNGVFLSPQKLRILCLSLGNYYPIEKEQWKNERELLKFGILNVMNEILISFGNVYVFENLPDEYIIAYSEECAELDIDNLFMELKHHLKTCFGFEVSGGLSETSDNYLRGQQLYRQAKRACDEKFIWGFGTLTRYQSLKCKNTIATDFNEKAEKFKKFISKLRDSEQIMPSIMDFRVSPDSVLADDAVRVRELFYIYHYEIISYIKQNNLTDLRKINEYLQYFSDKLRAYGTLPELNRWLEDIMTELSGRLETSNFVFKAKRYIDTNYNKEIYLREVADMLGVSESYLSRIFKRETGGGFSEYVLTVRINKAEELMRSGKYKVYEVAQQVGFSNVEYFSRQFKKITGKAPKEYK